jgi:aspartyl-tRNA(Asn)/glutamyl-tRNA(Gln) amidotransferase subunit A
MRIFDLSAKELRDKIVTGELSAVNVIKEVYDRIDRTDKEIGSFVFLRREKALEEAALLDEKIARG